MIEENCPFCKEIELHSRILYETPHTLTILSNPALMKGHILVIPKKHVEILAELNDDVRQELFEQVVKMQALLLRRFRGCDIKQNYRPFQKQDQYKVNHLHIHLLPREFQDELYKKSQIYEKEIFKDLNDEELDQMKEFILEEVKI
jgi:histidine triad (HIT) family protein